jgi:hypothetical protein
VASPNPGISAAGEAAGKTALNPSTGPAAIGGMVVPGEAEPEPEPPVYRRDPSDGEERLSAVVSDLSKLASAMRALSLSRYSKEAASRQKLWGRSGGAPFPTAGGARESVPAPESARAGGATKQANGLEATGSVTTGIGGYANGPAPSTDPHRQAASRSRG